jgi:hypothetical protein
VVDGSGDAVVDDDTRRRRTGTGTTRGGGGRGRGRHAARGLAAEEGDASRGDSLLVEGGSIRGGCRPPLVEGGPTRRCSGRPQVGESSGRRRPSISPIRRDCRRRDVRRAPCCDSER